MKQIFADTSYWIGLVNPRDQIHQKVIKITQQLFSVRLVTTEMVLGALLNSFSDSPFRQAVAGMVLKLRNDRNVRIVPQRSEQFESALRRYKQAADKSWSLTDCASFEVMEAERMTCTLRKRDLRRCCGEGVVPRFGRGLRRKNDARVPGRRILGGNPARA